MSYRVEFTDVADMEVENILLWIMGRAPERAERWQDGLEKAVQSLEDFPGRCALVLEVSTPERQVRQLLYGAYRLLFTLLDTDGDGNLDTVRILHVRHGAQKPIMQEDPEEAE
jgi:plasmid stabilization system protein ParE